MHPLKHPTLYLLRFLAPRQENPVWQMLHWQFRRNVRKEVYFYLTVLLAVAQMTLACVPYSQKTAIAHGLVLFTFLIVSVLFAREFFTPPLLLSKQLRRKSLQSEILVLPLCSRCFTSAFVRLFYFSAILTSFTTVVAFTSTVLIRPEDAEIRRIVIFAVFLLSWLLVFLWQIYWSTLAGGIWGLLPFFMFDIYAGLIVISAYEPQLVWLESPSFHAAFIAFMALLGLAPYDHCRRRYAERLRKQLFR